MSWYALPCLIHNVKPKKFHTTTKCDKFHTTKSSRIVVIYFRIDPSNESLGCKTKATRRRTSGSGLLGMRGES